MRNELEKIELIEKYLRNELSKEEKLAFEQRMETDKDFFKEVELQKDLVKAIERLGVKNAINKAYRKYKLGKAGFNFGIGSLIIVGIVSAFIWYNNLNTNNEEISKEQELLQLNEEGENFWADADRNLPSQKFILDGDNDTVIETNGGMVMYVPANCFVDEKGNPIKGEVEFEVKEALNTAEIIKAGLESKSGDRLLESAGMFYVNARKNGKTIHVDPENGIYTEIPADEIKPGMQLFEGERKKDGSIDWVNPRALDDFLIPVDIYSLNFYPPGYENTLDELCYDVRDKSFTDSLYYSFSHLYSLNNEPIQIVDAEVNFESDSVAYISEYDAIIDSSRLYINPAKIKSIWSKEFNNTLLATREFEKRLKVIFGTCNGLILDLYINNLDKNMYEIDAIAATMCFGENRKSFLDFAALKEGKVKIDESRSRMLREHYQQKQLMVIEAARSAWNKYNEENQRLNDIAINKRNEHWSNEYARLGENLIQELEINLDEAYRQLGKERPRRVIIPPARYSVVVTNNGWKNVDAYVVESTINRTTLDYTDPDTGKKAVIKYEALSVSILERKKYDRLYIYILPDKLNSFMRLNEKDSVFTENLNELMDYSLICLAYIDDKPYYFEKKSIGATNYYDLQLDEISDDKLNKKLGKFDSNKKDDLFTELAYIRFEIDEEKRMTKIENKAKLRRKIRPVIFPCLYYSKEYEYSEDIIKEAEW